MPIPDFGATLSAVVPDGPSQYQLIIVYKSLFLVAPAAEQQSDLSSHYGVCLDGWLFVDRI